MNIRELKLALINNSFEDFKKALKDFDINEKDNYGNILHYFIGGGFSNESTENYKEVIDLLIKKGIDINEKLTGRNKRSPLHIAVLFYKKEIADYLIELGADVNSTDENGNNILMTAVMWWSRINDDYYIKKLIENGADVNHENNFGRSAKMSALENDGNESIHKYFI